MEEITTAIHPAKPIRIGKYSLLAKIASGGMAEIYLARMAGPAGFEKLVVIKRILPHLAEDTHFIEMFLDEARIAARLDHPNIVQIYDLGTEGNEFFIAMEHLAGCPFSQLVIATKENRRRLDPYLCAALMAQACDGLYFAHNARSPDGQSLAIVHRDINHRNLVITFSGVVKIVDFGIAKSRDKLVKTNVGRVKGTIPYMSPEQVSGKEIDHRSDIFSLGIVFYEMLTLKSLFKRTNNPATIKAILDDEIPPLSKYRPDLDPAIEMVLDRALARDPEERYQNARDMQRDLHNAMDNAGSRISPAEISEYMELYMASHVERHRSMLDKVHSVGSNSSPISMVSKDTVADFPISISENMLGDDQAKKVSPGQKAPAPVAKRASLMPVILVSVLLLVTGSLAFWAWHLYRNEQDPSKASAGPSAATTITTIIETEPAGANILVNGKNTGLKTPAKLSNLPPGSESKIKITLSGYQAVERTFRPEPGRVTEMRLVLKQIPPTVKLLELPAGAMILVDGAVRVKASNQPTFDIELTPNQAHRLEVRKQGFIPFRQKLNLAAGQEQEIVVTLSKKKPVGHGTLAVSCTPWCRIYIDGRDSGRNSPATDIRLSAGKHRLRLVNPPTGKAKEIEVVVRKNQTTRKLVQLR